MIVPLGTSRHWAAARSDRIEPQAAARRRRRAGRPLSAILWVFLVVPIGRPSAAESKTARVIINEVMYHPPDDRDDLQFIELHNPGNQTVDLAGWSFTKGAHFVFPGGAALPPTGYAVVCHDAAAFRAHYGAGRNVVGSFTGRLSRKGERLELTDAQGRLVDVVRYDDREPWPLGADGYGASLERICATATGDDPANWAASEIQAGGHAGGTPGSGNSCRSPVPLPRISAVRFGSVEAGKPVSVTATIIDAAGVQSAGLTWRALSAEDTTPAREVPLVLQSGDARQGTYGGSIPAQPEGRLIRLTLWARSASGAERSCPAKTEPRPYFSCATFVNTNTARVPFLKILSLGPLERPRRSTRPRRPTGPVAEAAAEARSPWFSAAVYLPPNAKTVHVFDPVQLRPRNGGIKVHFLKDQPLEEMTGINLVFEASPRWLLAEPLAYELYRRAGVPAPATRHVRLWIDRQPLGYHLLIEQPNKSFLRRHGRDEQGNLYKVVWYGHGLVGQHEKKINAHTGHEDLVQLVEGLRGQTSARQWEYIQKEFNVPELINYYAVNMCIQNWDGFFNNYYAYHDLRPGGRWEVFPWDEDKTWGDYDGASSRYNWYEMPLTCGMNGDGPARASWLGSGPYGGAPWWRPPGYFSGPLLANPEFRRRFLDRLRELCQTTFTPDKMAPIIRALEVRLEDEVQVRAQLMNEDPASALLELRSHIQSFQNQVVNRRKFILKQLGSSR